MAQQEGAGVVGVAHALAQANHRVRRHRLARVLLAVAVAIQEHATLGFEIELVAAESAIKKASPDDKVPIDLKAP
jgi:hypothetical protein